MKEIRALLPDDLVLKLEELSARLGISPEELVRQGVAEYLKRLEAGMTFDPVGYGMWKDRAEMQDAVKWVRALRDREWRC